ncbi:MAG TPA: HEAT repeat domain-containing protein, partial [Elusimicrobiota bacterium]|nr:HEAT repeat domain-containing protein [Elusimicrobiota bacterium]
CEGWLWPPETGSRGSFAVSKADTPADENGCRYVRFLKQGGIRCPAGTIAKGLGQAPAPPDLLAGSADSGVALCCPPDVTAPEGAAPQEVECRVHPMECPAGWSEMEAPADRERALESGRYSRTRRMREGDIQWVHCCRPHELARGPQAPEDVWSAPPAAPEQPPAEPARGSGPVSAPMPEGRSATEAAPAAPDREVAIDLRLAELDRLLGSPESFPPQKSLQRPEAAVDADAGVQAPARRGAEPSLAAVPGASESLSGPAGPGARTDPRVRGDSAFMPDAGMRKTNRPLPELLKLLESRDPRARARAADEIGSLGAEGRPAVARLKTALKDSSARVRAAAALALGSASRGGDDAVRELARALKDRSADVRYCAAEALGRIGTPAADRAFGGHILRSAKTLAQGG